MATASDAVAKVGQAEGVGVPGLAIHGHDVGMARQRHAGDVGWADGGKQVGFLTVVRNHQMAGDLATGEIIFDEPNKSEVAVMARRVEGHEAR